jgi:hypothetical protein
LDVGLALAFTGISFLVWALVAGMSRTMMKNLIHDADALNMELPGLTVVVKVFFVDTGFVIDVVGLALMLISLVLVFIASRQRISISWAWAVAMLQAFVAALGATLVSGACYLPYRLPIETVPSGALETISQISLPVVVGLAIFLWVVCLVGLLVDRARLDRHGPSLTDGLRTNR